MKSYIKFLSRNKAYASIDVFGLAVSMMFVVLIGCYTWQETHVDTQQSKADRMYFLGCEIMGKKKLGSHWHVQHLLKGKFPEIESSTALFRNARWLFLDGKKIMTNCYFVDSTFYDVFDFKLIQGDPKTALDNPASLVVTQEYARKVWGDEDPMGKTIMFAGDEPPFVVTGVMEPMKNTAFMTNEKQPVDVLLNFNMVDHVNPSMTDTNMPNATGSEVILLAEEGHDLTKMKKEYEKALKNDFWVLNLPEGQIHIEVYPFNDVYFSDMSSDNMNFGDIKMIKLLFGTGLVILLFAIMNYINLTVALAGKRAKEMATRRLLGEGRMEIMWRLIAESSILCSFSMILGIALAFLMQPYASSLLKTPIHITDCVNVTTVGVLVAVLLIMSLASGLIPALLLSSMKPIEAVKGAFKRKSNMVFGKVFIVVQNVATITMVACALTMYLQVRHLIEAPLGYDYSGVIQLECEYMEANGQSFKNELLKLPCVEKASYCCGTPPDRGNNTTLNQNGHTISFQLFTADSAYMDLLGLKLKKDNHTSSYPKNYFNLQALNELEVNEDASHILFWDEQIEVGGILEDFKIGNILTDQHPIRIEIKKPFEQFKPWTILIKVKGDEKEALRQVKELYEKLYANGSSDYAFEQPFMHQEIEKDFDAQRRLSIILTVFALIAIMISMLGLMAMSTYYVRQRSMDIAVHKVMGGTSGEVLTRLVRTFMTYVLIAAAISIPIIYYVMNDWLSQFSYRIPVYWWIYASAALIAIAICFVSVATQCRKAANTNPIESLK
ncbi:MAG: hypothetical protein HDR47_01905 [Bacteroides sp.]|nr:hypothetical protein [Bacteroides sp.]